MTCSLLAPYRDLLQLSSGPYDALPDKKSFSDALRVLKFNTQYPLSLLDLSGANARISELFRTQVLESVEVLIKYRGYIEREQKQAEKVERLEHLRIPTDFDYDKLQSLSIESRQKLKRYKPETIAQASRISGVSPSDISVLLVYFGR